MTSPHTLSRLFVDDSLQENRIIQLGPEQSHYLINVMRAQEGDSVRIFNELDGEWLCKLQEIKKKAAFLIIGKNYRRPLPNPDLWLCAAPIKRNYFDFMVMKATELGVSVIQPVLTAHTHVRDVNIARLRAIAIEAAEQSERLSIPEIRQPLAATKLVEHWSQNRLPLLCAEFGNAQPIASALKNIQPHTSAAIIVGPEGGFTQDEMKMFHALPHAVAMRLGPRILRADTAAIAAITCWQALCGDWKNEGDS